MRNLFIILFVTILLFSCTHTDERNEVNFTVRISNDSNDEIIIKGYTSQNNLGFEHTLESMVSGGEINYFSETFGGYTNGADSIVVMFTNSKGYICDLRQNGNNLCFSNKNLFGGESNFNNLENNNFEFIITQSDFNNANDLP